MDIRRIPILSLSSTISMTDLMSELPLPAPHPDPSNQSLWYNQDIYNEATKILNSNNKPIFDSIAKALSSTTTDEILLKDSSPNEVKTNVNTFPSIFRQMVKKDLEKFKDKVGFEEFFIKETPVVNEVIKSTESLRIKEKSEKSIKKKKKKHKESEPPKISLIQLEQETYTVSHSPNRLKLSFKKIKPPESSAEPIQPPIISLPIAPVETQVKKNVSDNEIATVQPTLEAAVNINNNNNESTEPFHILSKMKLESSLEIIENHHIIEEVVKPKENSNTKLTEDNTTIKPTNQLCPIDNNYFAEVVGLSRPTDMFNNTSIFEPNGSSLPTIEIPNSTEDFPDADSFQQNPHQNSLSVNELQLTKSVVKNEIMRIDYITVCENHSPVHDDTQLYNQSNQQFGLAAYLTKTTNSNSNNISSTNTNSVLNHTDTQPGSCVSATPNSVDIYDPKTSEASVSESFNVQNNNPNSAQSEIESSERKIDKRGKGRGRNKELENLMKWQIKDKGMPPVVDPLDSATVGPGERVKKRTRHCVQSRTEREDCSSISENSYHTPDISPAAPEIAQNIHSIKSESSFCDELRSSPATTYPTLTAIPFCNTPSPFDFNHLPFNDNAQLMNSMQTMNQDINFNSTDIASSLASITPDEELPEITEHSKIVMKGKKLPNTIENRISGKTPIKDSHRDLNSNRGSLPVEIVGNTSDQSSDSSDYMPKTKLKSSTKNSKRPKKAKNLPYTKPVSNSDSRIQHLFANKESKLVSHDRVFRASQYNRNMNPIIVLSPLPNNYDDDDDDLGSPSSTSTMSTLPFTYEHEQELLSSDFEASQTKSKHCEHLKNQFFTFLDSLLKDVEELDLLNIVSNYKNPIDLEAFGYSDNDAILSPDSLNLLNNHVAKMKASNLMHQVPVGKLVRLLTLLLVNMNSFMKVPFESKKKVQKLLQEQILKCLDASLIALSIMISPDMPRAVFLEDVIEHACDLFRTILKHNIYPIYDTNVKSQPNSNDVLLNIITNININKYQSEFLSKLTARVQCGINCLSELMQQHPNRLTDEAVLKLTSLAISSLSVNNVNDIQLSLIPLLAAVFCQYEGHRKSVVGELLSIMTHSQNKKVIRKYKINNDEEIQTITAVILILFQSVVQKPKSNKKSNSNKSLPTIDFGVEQGVASTVNSSIRIMQIFVQTFFKKVCFKGEESYKLSFERFIQDLFLTFNKPEWPAANCFLNYIGTTLICHLNTSQTNRNVAIDLLGTICSFMCRHINIDNFNNKTASTVLKELIVTIRKSSQSKVQSCDLLQSKSEDEQIRILKSLLLNFLTMDASDTTCMYARRYWAGVWLQDFVAVDNGAQSIKVDNKPLDQIRNLSKSEEIWKNTLLGQLAPNCQEILIEDISGLSYDNACNISRFLSLNKDGQSFEVYLSRICKSLDENSVPARTKSMRSLTLVLEEDPTLLMKSEIEKSVNRRFLDSSTAVREATVDLVGKFLMKKPELVTQYYPVMINRIVDTGTSVRKRVIKVLWDICTTQNDFPNTAEVYAKIMKRMNDEESIKKLVNEVFKSIWFTPISDKDPVKLQLRIFSIANVIHALGNDQKCNHNWVLQFISQLSSCETDQSSDVKSQRNFEKSYQQIVECLVQTVLRLQDVSSSSMEFDSGPSQSSKSVFSSQQKLLCSTWSALHIFTKVRPKLVWPYLHELSVLVRQIRAPSNGVGLKQTLILNSEMAICMNHLCGTLDAGLGVLNSLEDLEYSNINLTKENLNDIASDLINLATNAPSRFIVDSAIKCLRRVTGFTQEFTGIRNCFSKFFTSAMRLTETLKLSPKQWKTNDSKLVTLCRILYTSVGLCRFFDMKELLNENLLSQSNSVFSRLLDITIYCAENSPQNSELRNKAIFNMNHLVHKDHELLVSGPVHKFYISTLNLIHNEKVLSNDSARMITCVLDNISNFLKHNELKMVEENSTWKSRAQSESLKITNDVSGSFGNVVAQLYLKLVLDCCMCGRTEVRLSALNLVCKILSQGLVQPMFAMGYLIALQGDPDNGVRGKADCQLTELNSKYQGFLNIRAICGIRLSYKLQTSISNLSIKDNDNDGKTLKLVRGWSYVNGNMVQIGNSEQNNNFQSIQAINHQLYSCLRRNKQHWRSFLDGMINLFDESHQCDLTEQIFIADQLASFPYQIQEEPVFLVHKLDLLLSVVGPTILRCCKDVFKLFSKPIADRAYKDGELTHNELTIVVKMLSESTFENRQLVYLSIKSSRVSLLMIALKEYIKNVYGIVDNKITSYSPDNNSKQWDKQVSRNVTTDQFEVPEKCLIKVPDLEKLKTTEVSVDIVRQLVLDYLDFRNKLIVIDLKIKPPEQQMEIPTLSNFMIDVEKSKTENVVKKREFVDNHTDIASKPKAKISRIDQMSESEISDTSTSDSLKRFSPKKKKMTHSTNNANRTPIAGKEIPNHSAKDTTANHNKSHKLPGDNKKISSVNKSKNTPNKTKFVEKNAGRPSLTALPSDLMGNSTNSSKFKPSSTTKSFKNVTNNFDSEQKGYISQRTASSDYVNQSADRRPSSYNKSNAPNKVLSTKNDEKSHKRLGDSIHSQKPKKRKRMVISSSSDSSMDSD